MSEIKPRKPRLSFGINSASMEQLPSHRKNSLLYSESISDEEGGASFDHRQSDDEAPLTARQFLQQPFKAHSSLGIPTKVPFSLSSPSSRAGSTEEDSSASEMRTFGKDGGSTPQRCGPFDSTCTRDDPFSSYATNWRRFALNSATLDTTTTAKTVAFVDDNDDEEEPGLGPLRSALMTHNASVPNVDAQELYPPSACIFVANLPESRDDHTLVAELTRELTRFGTVCVKIRRDAKNMPFAFCQFTRDEHAKTAIELGKDIVVGGRYCRMEMTRGNVNYVVARRGRIPIGVDEAHDLLAPFGRIDKVEVLNKQVCDLFGTGHAVLVTFARYDAHRNPPVAFRDHPEYRVEAFDLKRNSSNQPARNHPEEAYLEQYDMDRRSVYLGGIQQSLTETDIRSLMEQIGPVIKVQLIKKAPTIGPYQTSFAFVEFSRMDMPDMAIDRFHGTILEGHILRVERKQIREHLRASGIASTLAQAQAQNPTWALSGLGVDEQHHVLTTSGTKYRSVTSPMRRIVTPAMLPPTRAGVAETGTLARRHFFNNNREPIAAPTAQRASIINSGMWATPHLEGHNATDPRTPWNSTSHARLPSGYHHHQASSVPFTGHHPYLEIPAPHPHPHGKASNQSVFPPAPQSQAQYGSPFHPTPRVASFAGPVPAQMGGPSQDHGFANNGYNHGPGLATYGQEVHPGLLPSMMAHQPRMPFNLDQHAAPSPHGSLRPSFRRGMPYLTPDLYDLLPGNDGNPLPNHHAENMAPTLQQNNNNNGEGGYAGMMGLPFQGGAGAYQAQGRNGRVDFSAYPAEPSPQGVMGM